MATVWSHSEFMSKPVDVHEHARIFAGLHKNAGTSGIAVDSVRDDFSSFVEVHPELGQHVRVLHGRV